MTAQEQLQNFEGALHRIAMTHGSRAASSARSKARVAADEERLARERADDASLLPEVRKAAGRQAKAWAAIGRALA